MNDLIQTIAVYALPVIFAITLHEAAHAYAAKYFGDTTAFSQGRMSLDPLKHIDPFGTILLPILTFSVASTAGIPFVFGYAKPVPVVFGNLRHPKRDMAWVALAGPAANFVMALLWLIFAVGLQAAQVQTAFFHAMAKAGFYTNLAIFAFNLFPLPPLDGGRIMFSILPQRLAWQYAKIEPYGMYVLLGLILLGQFNIHVLQYWMTPVMYLAQLGLNLLITPFSYFLN